MVQIKIAIVDDHGIFIKGLKTLFKSFRDIKILMEAENGSDFIEKLKIEVPDIVLLDVDMPKMDGVETTAYLTKHHPDLKVIILTHHHSEEIMLHLIELGARGFLLKNNTIETIVDAIYSVKENGYFFNDKVPRALVKELMITKKIKPKFEKVTLTERELEVFELVCKECTNLYIAEKLHIDTTTVETHKKNIIKKTGAKNIIGAVMYAIKNGLIE